MILHVLNAHTGQSYTVDSEHLTSTDTFKTWLAQASGVATTHQILLTEGGKQVKLQSLQDGAQIFLYNRQFLSPSSSTARRLSVQPSPSTQIPTLQDFPQDSVQPNDLEGWRFLFRARQEWAEDVQTKALAAASELDNNRKALAIIHKGTEVALGNLQSHVRTLDQKYQEASAWAGDLMKEQDRAIEDAGALIPCLEALPAKTALFKYLPRLSENDDAIHEDDSTLADLAKQKDFQRYRTTLQKSQNSLRSQLDILGSAVEEVIQDTDIIVQSVATAKANETNSIGTDMEQIEEIQVLVEKVGSDLVHIEELIGEGRLTGQAARIASLQTKNYLPTLVKYYEEIAHDLRTRMQQRDSAVQEAVQNMQRIAKTEASFASVHTKVSGFDLSREAADAAEAISIVSDLAHAYAVLLVESVRRTDWSDKLRTESVLIAEDFAGHQEEEEKRRQKWLKNNRHLMTEVPPDNAVSLKLDVPHNDHELPSATKADLSSYKQALSRFAVLKGTLDRVSEAMEDLDKSSKKQMKKAQGFKSGSVYDAGSGRSSLLSRDSDEITTLKEINQKLEEETRAQKSRVRKLENLVFNQTQTNRSSSTNLFQSPALPRPESPVPPDPAVSPMSSPKSNIELLSRKASVNSRRASGHQSQDEKVLARRIVTLEAEMHEEAQKNHILEKEKRQLQIDGEQDRATTQDLMANMDAQRQEFAGERRMLREEVADWKRKFVEVEDELDRIVGSRENDRAESDERLRDTRKQLADVKAKLHRREEESRDHKATLEAIRRNMDYSSDPNVESPPAQSLTDLVHSLARLSDQASLHRLRLQEAVDYAKIENENLKSTIIKTTAEREQSAAQRLALQQSHDLLLVEMDAGKARISTLEAEIEDGRLQLRNLRAKFAEGETGSAVLQQRLEDQAAKATKATSDLAEVQSEVEHLKHELSVLKSRQLGAGHEVLMITERLARRSAKDAELSHRLANYVSELVRLLDALGLSILEREDGTMTIQRTSKLTSTSQTLSDISSPKLISPLGRPFDLTIPQELLQWPQKSSLVEEDQAFGVFLSRIDALDLPALSDSILKLRRDVEWTGKKWKAEARSYRDKLHTATSDSTHKIAFRGFKEGDLALFLPTRNQAMRPWAAFNVGAPHYFLRETDSHHLQSREWLVARISKIQERVVDLSGKNSGTTAGTSTAETTSLRSAASSSAISFEDDNPFDLSDGLRWYLIDAVEEKVGNSTLSATTSVAASTSMNRHIRTASSVHGKSTPTTGTACVDATGTSVKIGKGKLGDASTKLGQSLESRRSSTTSRAGSIRATKDGASDVSVRVDLPKTVNKKSSMVNVSALTRGLLGMETARKDTDVEASGAGQAGNDESAQAQKQPASLFSLFTTHKPSSVSVSISPASEQMQAPSMRRTISQSVKPTSTSAFFTEGPSADPTTITINTNKQEFKRSTQPPPFTNTPPVQKTPTKQSQRASSVSASSVQVSSKEPKIEGGGEKKWKSLWSLNVNIEEEERKRH